jgi:HlyD family secretion protein
MNIKKLIGISAMVLFVFGSCSVGEQESDAYGNFEAVDYVIAAENNGKLVFLNLEEGDVFDTKTQVGVIDTTQLYLQKEQLRSKRKSVASGINNILSRIAVYEEQQSILYKDKARVDKMYQDGAATQKDVDDIDGNILVIHKQIKAVKTENAQVLAELESMDYQIKALNDLIHKSVIFIPEPATVLEKYREAYEMVTVGAPLFKLADMSSLDLRVYVDGTQLHQIKLGQKVDVLIDDSAKDNQLLEGDVIWISSQSEFTPKIVQTKEERVKLVYAVKVRVKNDGQLKIGMPGEIRIR